MPNWAKLSDERKRTLIADTLIRIEKDRGGHSATSVFLQV